MTFSYLDSVRQRLHRVIYMCFSIAKESSHVILYKPYTFHFEIICAILIRWVCLEIFLRGGGMKGDRGVSICGKRRGDLPQRLVRIISRLNNSIERN